MSPLLALFKREHLIARRLGGSGAMGVAFLLTIVAIAPFALGPDLVLLARIGPAILWIGALLSMLLSLDRLFQADREDGALDMMQQSETPLELLVLVKCISHWLTTGVPLAVAAPLLGLMFAQDAKTLPGLALSILIGTPALTFIGAIGAAVTVTLRRGGLVLALLVLPLCVPVLIFGVAAAEVSRDGSGTSLGPLAMLAAMTLASGALAPFAAAAALRGLGD